MPQTKIDHKKFLELGERIRHSLDRGAGFIPTADDLGILMEHVDWFVSYIKGRSVAGSLTENPGRKRKADDEIKPASLKRRRIREEKKQSEEARGHSGPGDDGTAGP